MKTYTKPAIAFQSLMLATNISSGCIYSATANPAECPVEIPGQPGLTLFLENSACMMYSPKQTVSSAITYPQQTQTFLNLNFRKPYHLIPTIRLFRTRKKR